jgi:hypothetical protein
MVRGPMMAEVTPGWLIANATAMWVSLRPQRTDTDEDDSQPTCGYCGRNAEGDHDHVALKRARVCLDPAGDRVDRPDYGPHEPDPGLTRSR